MRQRSTWKPVLLTLLSIVMLAAAPYLPIYLRYRQQMRAIAAIERLGGTVKIHREPPHWLSGLLPDGNFWDTSPRIGPNWVREWLPVETVIEHFLIVDEVAISNAPDEPAGRHPTSHPSDKKPANANDDDLRRLAAFPHLRRLYLRDVPISDAGLRHLRGLRDLEVLNLDFTKIADAGLEIVAGFEKLTSVSLAGTNVTDAGVARLARLRHLREVDLSATHVTDDGLRGLSGQPGLKLISDSTSVRWHGIAAQ
ncbi:MAG: leucine-rich repeat domain-containing protein [Deltaproteobacteria bacterium]